MLTKSILFVFWMTAYTRYFFVELRSKIGLYQAAGDDIALRIFTSEENAFLIRLIIQSFVSSNEKDSTFLL